MKRIGIVVQRCGEEIVGGSESYALQMAKILSSNFDVDILTTTAKDHITWENYYKEGIEKISDTLKIVRFSVDFKRGDYWHELNRILFKNLPLDKFSSLDPVSKEEYIKGIKNAPFGLQEEWMRFQGPFSSNLFNYLKQQENKYDLFIFMTYLYPTTYFGVDMIENKNKIFIIPTLHDEPPAYLSIFKKYLTYKFLFLTEAEKRLASRIFRRELASNVIGFGLEDKFSKINTTNRNEKYILYAGRLEVAKGVPKLYDYYTKFSEKYREKYRDIKLYTIGDGPLKDFVHESIEYHGFVDEEEKLSLMKGAIAFVHPSPYESLGIVLLEAFMMGVPALVNAQSEVLKDHIESSKGGFIYNSYEEFEESLIRLIENEELRNKLGENAREYFLKNYSIYAYKQRLHNYLFSK